MPFSYLNESENEGLVVVGRPIESMKEHDRIRALADAVDAWADRLSLPLALVFCGSTINWPPRRGEGSPAPHQVNDDPSHYGLLIGLVTFDGAGDDDDDVAGVVEPSAMDRQQAERIPDAFWSDLHEKHGVALANPVDVYLAAAGWTWARLEGEGQELQVSADDNGYCVIPEEARSEALTMKVGYC